MLKKAGIVIFFAVILITVLLRQSKLNFNSLFSSPKTVKETSPPLAVGEYDRGDVLAAGEENTTDTIFFNIPAVFKKNITAPNIVYGLTAGPGITITGDPQQPVISSDAGGGVTSIGGQTGDIVLNGGTGITVEGNTFTNTGVTSIQGQTGSVTFTAGDNISIDGTTISAEVPAAVINDGFSTIAVSGESNIEAGEAEATLNVEAGAGVTITTDPNTKTLTIAAAAGASAVTSVTGTPNQITATPTTGDVVLTLPQDIATTSNVTFNQLTATTQLNSPALSNGAGNITFTAGGRTFIFPTSGGPSQTICTTGVTCASGGGQAVLLAPGSAQTDSSADVAIFINDTGGGNLLELQQSGSDVFVVNATGDTTIGGSLNANGNVTLGDAATDTVTFNGTIQGTNVFTFEGATANASEITLAVQDPTADITYRFADAAAGSYDICTSAGNCVGGGGGAPADAQYLTLALNGSLSNERVVTAGTNIGLTDAGANGNLTIAVVDNPTFAGDVTNNANTTLGDSAADLVTFNAVVQGATPFVFEGATANAFETSIAVTDPTADRTITVPNASGTVAVSASGNIALDAAGNITFTGILPVTNGGTGAGTFTTNGVVYGGASGLESTAAGTSGQVLIANGSGVPTFVSFSGDVAVDNTGATVIQPNAVALGTDTTGSYVATIAGNSQITVTGSGSETAGVTLAITADSIGDAQLAFDTGQNLTTASSPSFAGLTVTGALSATGNVTLGDALADLITITGTLQNSTLVFEGATADGNETTIAIVDPTADITYRFADAAAGTYDICTTAANCVGVGGSAPSDAQYLTLALNASLTNERVATAGTNISLTDAGANGALTIATINNPTFSGLITGQAGLTISAGTVSLPNGQIDNAELANSSITFAGDTGSSATSLGGTRTIAGGTNGIDTAEAAGTLTINLDTTEIGTTTFGSGSGITWTFNSGAGTDPTIGFGNDTITTTASSLTQTGDFSVTGNTALAGALNANGTTTIGDASTDLLTITSTIQGATPFVFEGATADAFETTIGIVDPTADITYRFADAAAGTYDICTTAANCVGSGGSAPSDAQYLTLALNASLSNERVATSGTNIVLTDGGANGSLTIATVNNPTFSGLITGQAGLTISAGTVSVPNGEIDNAELANSSITFAGDTGSSATALGGTRTIAGGTNGIDTAEATGTVTLNLDTTEIGTTTFGSGSGITWTFDASGGTDGTIAFGNNTINTTTGTLTQTGAFVVTSTTDLQGNVANSTGVFTIDDDSTINGNTVFGDASTDTITFTGTIQGANPLTFEGATSDAFETTLAIQDPTADVTYRLMTTSAGTYDICTSAGNCIGGGSGSAPADAEYLTLSTNANLTNERVATAGTNINFTDAGANGSLTIAVVNNPTFSGTVTANGDVVLGNANTDTVVINAGTSGAGIRLADASFASCGVLNTDAQGDLVCGTAGSGMSSFVVAGDSGSNQTITDGNTLSIVGGTNGIDTVGSATDILTLNLDTTEIGTTTFGSGSAITWTFDASGGTDGTIAFGNNTINTTTGTLTQTGAFVVTSTTDLQGTISNSTGTLVFGDDVSITGTSTIGDAATDLVTFNGTIQGANPFVFEGATADGFETTLAVEDPTADVTYRLMTTTAGTYDICTSAGNCIGGGSGSAPADAEYLTLTNNANLTNERAATEGTNIAFTDAGANGTLTISVIDDPTFAGLITGQAGLTISAGTVSVPNGEIDNAELANSSITFAGDTGSSATALGGTRTIAGGTNGIDTAEATGTVTLNLDTTEIGTTTFGSGSGITWTFDASGGTDGTIAFGNNTITTTTGTLTQTGAFVVTSTSDLRGAVSNSTGTLSLNDDVSIAESTTLGDAATDLITFTGTIQGANPFVFEGATSDAFETTLAIEDPTADVTYRLLTTSAGTYDICTSSGNCIGGGGGGAPYDAEYLTLAANGSLTNERTATAGTNISFTDAGANGSLTIAVVNNPTFSGTVTANGDTVIGSDAADAITFNGTVQGNTIFSIEGATADGFETTLSVQDPTADITYRFADAAAGTYDLCTSAGNCLGGGGGAPGDATYLTLTSNGSLSNERVLTEGAAIDLTDAGANSTLTIAFDSTEVGTTTFGSGSGITWTFDASAGTDSTIAFGNNTITSTTGTFTQTGAFSATGNTTIGDANTDTLTINAGTSGTGITFADSSFANCTLTTVSNILTCGATGGTMSSFTLAGDSGANQTITNGNTLAINGGTNGIDTVGTATDAVVLNLDTTEIGTTTFGSGSGITWTFDAGASDPTIAFGSGTIGLTATTTTVTGALSVTGDTTLGDATADMITFTGTIQGGSPFVFEGATADAFETTLAVEDPTADVTYQLQTAAAGTYNICTTAAVCTGYLGTTGTLFTLAGDTGSNQTISGGDTVSVTGGTNGIDTVGTATDAVVLNLDTTEIGTTTFGSGSGITWTFDAGATDPTIAFGSGTIGLTATTVTTTGASVVTGTSDLRGAVSNSTGTLSLNDDVSIAGNTTLGDAATDLVTVTGTIQGSSPFIFEGATADAFETTLTIEDPTADVTYQLQTAAAGTYNICTTAAVCTGYLGTTGTLFTLAGDTGSNQTISGGDTVSVTGGTNGIDTVGTATDSVVLNLDTTEIGTTTFGSGSGITWTFDAGASDPTIAFGSGTIGLTATTTTATGAFSVTGNTTIGDASGDTVTLNAATVTVANDTNLVLSGGTNGLSFDTTTLSIDAANNRVGIGTTAPSGILHVSEDSYVPVYFDTYSSTNNYDRPDVTLRRGRGSAGSAATVAQGDYLGTMSFYGYSGGDFYQGAEIRASVSGTPGAADMPTTLRFMTSADGSSNPTQRMTIYESGTVSIGASDQFYVNSSGAIGAATGISSSGTIAFSGLSTDGYVKTTGGTGTLTVSSTITSTDISGTLFTLSGDSGSDQTLTQGNTIEIAGGTNGIDTVGTATDTVTLNLDTTEIGTTTFGSGSGITWTFDAGASDPTIAFGSGTVNITATTTTATGAFSVTGNTTLGDANTDTVTINAGTSGTGVRLVDASFASCTALETDASGDITCGTDDGGGMTSFVVAGDSGANQTITDGNTVTYAGGTNGIDTVGSATDTITFNLDTTEIGTTTFGSGSGITWTFDASGGTDTTIAFGNNTQTFTTGTATFSGDVTIQGGDILGANSAAIDIGESTSGAITLTPASTGDSVFVGDSDSNTQVTTTSSGVDYMAITDAGSGPTTNGVDGLQISFDQEDDADASDTNALIHLVGTSSSGDSDRLYGLFVDSLTGSTSNEYGIQIASGWDRELNITTTGASQMINGTITGSTNTTGDVLFTIDSAQSGHQGFIVDFTVNDGTTGSSEPKASAVYLGSNDADAGSTALYLETLNTTNGTAGTYGSIAHLRNTETTADSVSNYLLIDTSSTDTATDAIDVSDSDFFNAINVGTNFILGDGIRQFSASSTVWTIEDTSGNDLMTITDGGTTGNVAVTGTLAVNGNSTIGDANSDTLTINAGTSGTGITLADSSFANCTLTTVSNVLTCGSAAVASGWTDGGTDVYVTTTTDEVGIGTTAPTAKLHIVQASAGTQSLVIDAATTDTTATGGVLDLNVDVGNAAVNALNIDFTQSDGASAGTDAIAQAISLQANDADGDVFGISITAESTANAAAGSYESLIRLLNAEPTVGAVSNAIFIDGFSGTDGDITDAIDASSSSITNALNAGQNFILGDGIRQFSASSTVWTIEDTAGNDLMTITDAGTTGNVVITGTSSVNGNTTLGDANTDTLTINAGTSGTGITLADSSFANCTLTTVSNVLTCGAGGGSMTSFVVAGDSGANQTITDGNTVTYAGGTNGIDTVGSATDTITFNLDTTEIGTTTFGSGSGITWTFDAGASDPTIAFGSGTIGLTATTVTTTGASVVTGTSDLRGAVSNSTGTLSLNDDVSIAGNTTLGDAATDLITVTGTIQGANPFIFEGATADAFETTLAIQDPTADVTYQLQTAAAGTYNICTTAAVCTGYLGTTGTLFTLAGDSGANQTISGGDTVSISGGTNGIDTVGTATDSVVLNLDTTEIGTTTFGSGSGITWTFDAGASDPTIAFGSGTIGLTATTTTVTGALSITGNTTIGDASGDTVTANAATWTFANDTNFVLSGGTNGLSFDTTTLSIDATNNRIGIGTTTPSDTLHIVGEETIVSGEVNAHAIGAYPLDVNGAALAIGDYRSAQTYANGLGIKFIDNGVAHSSIKYVSSAERFDFCDSSASSNSLACDGTPALSIELNSNEVGIGTTAPGYALQVGNVFAVDTAGNKTITPDANVSGRFIDYDNNSYYLDPANTGVSLDVAGSVGIGITTPTGRLQVTGDEVRIGDAGTIGTATGDGDLYVEDALEVDGELVGTTLSGFGLADCDSSGSKLLWDATAKVFSCGTDRASQTIVKTANETVANTTLQNDDHFTFALGTSETWIIDIHSQSSAAGGIKLTATAPASSTCRQWYEILDQTQPTGANQTCGSTTNMANNGSWGGGGFYEELHYSAQITTAGTSGTFNLQWAENTSNATGTILYSGGWMVAYKVSGADLAEIYYSPESDVTPGTVMAIDGQSGSSVRKATVPYSSSLLGVVSTKPGQVLGDDSIPTGRPVPIALTGRVPVKVTTENGGIDPGDVLTASATKPGFAMKATRAGYVIGRALTGFHGEGEGVLMLFANTHYADPATFMKLDPFGIRADDGTDLNETLSITYDEDNELVIRNENGEFNYPGLAVDKKKDIKVSDLLSRLDELASRSAQLASSSALLTAKDRALLGKLSLDADGNVTTDKLKAGSITAKNITIVKESTQSATPVASSSAGFDLALRFDTIEKDLDILKGQVLAASISATLNDPGSSINTSTASAQFDNLAVLGNTNLFNLGVTGDINVGLLNISSGLGAGATASDSASISTLAGPLKLQANALGGIDFLNGKATIDTDGNFVVNASITTKQLKIDASDESSASIGNGIIQTGSTTVVINTTAAHTNSRIFVTPKSKTATPLSVTEQANGTFTIELGTAQGTDVTFNWWIVN